jgi:iron complex transport system ATP-binding protein
VIEVRAAEVHYDRAHIGPIDLTVVPQRWTCLIGPNGAGKSTILRAIAGLVPMRGTVAVDDRDLASLPPRHLAQLVAYVPQQPVLPEDMAVGEYVLLGRTPYIATFAVESRRDREIAAEVLHDLDLSALADRLLGQLSGGERQRVVLARALAQQAPILLLDEPTSALDVGHAQQVLELIDRLRRERSLTVLAAMHDLTLAAQYADVLVLLQRGSIVASGAPADVITSDTMSRYYQASVRVMTDECGGIIVVPVRAHR